MIVVTARIRLHESVLEWHAVRAQGAGGQNVNKVSSAVHLRVNIRAAGLPPAVEQRLLSLSDHRITPAGDIVIKAQTFRTQAANRRDALARLVDLLRSASHTPKTRRPTQPSRAAQQRRLTRKAQHSKKKQGRGRPTRIDHE